MPQPIDPKKSTRLGQISFFQICKWISDHMVEIVPGKTHAELCQFLNEGEELEPSLPSGGLGVHSVPAIIRATGYTPAAPGSRSKSERTKITKAKFQELERKVAKLREDVNAYRESQNRLITTIQEVRDNAIGDKRDWDILNEDQISTGVPPSPVPPTQEAKEHTIKEHAKEIKVHDDNDAQLDDIYPEDAPHQEEYKEAQEQGAFEADLSDVSFKGFQPSAEIQKIIDEGNESARKQAEANKEDQVTNFPE